MQLRISQPGTSGCIVHLQLPVLSKTHHPLFHYFKQKFAQVTNPPIDAIREEVVTSTTVYIGTDGNILEETPQNCNVMQVHNPILTNTDIMKIKSMKKDGFKVEVIPITYYKNTSLERAIDRLFVEVDRAYRDGVNIMILSDRGVDENHVALLVFAIGVIIFCELSRVLSSIPLISETIEKYERIIVPLVFIPLGLYIMYENGTIETFLNFIL